MKAHELRRLLGLITTLSVEQLAQLKWQLAAGDEAQAVLAIIEGRVQAQPKCPLGLDHFRGNPGVRSVRDNVASA